MKDNVAFTFGHANRPSHSWTQIGRAGSPCPPPIANQNNLVPAMHILPSHRLLARGVHAASPLIATVAQHQFDHHPSFRWWTGSSAWPCSGSPVK